MNAGALASANWWNSNEDKNSLWDFKKFRKKNNLKQNLLN